MMESDIVDRGIVSQLQALAARSASPDLLAELVESYRVTAETRIPELRRAAFDGDAATLERVAHLLAGAAASVGLPQVNAAARAIELAAREGNGGVEALLGELDAAHAAGIDAIVCALRA
jgi:HPt (histidine-containing phosphotransfer) domain-containing protein